MTEGFEFLKCLYEFGIESAGGLDFNWRILCFFKLNFKNTLPIPFRVFNTLPESGLLAARRRGQMDDWDVYIRNRSRRPLSSTHSPFHHP